MCRGRSLLVDLALSQPDARTLAVAQAEGRHGSNDKRNMYLAKEGHIDEGSVAWQNMSESDRWRFRVLIVLQSRLSAQHTSSRHTRHQGITFAFP